MSCNVVSKIFQLPSQKGTDLQSQITQMPTKLVIKGVEPGTPLAGAVADHFGGRLKQFHVKQQQNYALSPTAIHRSHIEWKGGRATYVNQGGQEYLTLEVDPQLLKQLVEKKKPKFPDAVLISFEYPSGMWGIYPYHVAYIRGKNYGTSYPYPNTAFDASGAYSDDGSKNPVIAFPPTTNTHARYEPVTIVENSDGSCRATLLVDTFSIKSAVTIDIYCQLGLDYHLGATCQHVAWDNPVQTTLINTLDYVAPYDWYDIMTFSFPGTYVAATDYSIPIQAAPFNENWGSVVLQLNASQGYNTITPPGSYSNFMAVADVPAGFTGTSISDYVSISAYVGVPPTATFTLANGSGTTGYYSHLTAYRSQLKRLTTWSKSYALVLATPAVIRPLNVTARVMYHENKLHISSTSGTQINSTANCGSFNLYQSFISWEQVPALPRPAGTLLGHATATSVYQGGPGNITDHFGNGFVCSITFDPTTGGVSMGHTPPA